MSTVADSIPKEGLDFNYCGVNQVSTRTITLTNPGATNQRFEIAADNIPFTFSMTKGTNINIILNHYTHWNII